MSQSDLKESRVHVLISPGSRRSRHWEPEEGPTGHSGAAGHDRSRQRWEDHCSPSGDHNPRGTGQQDLHSYPVVGRTGRLQGVSTSKAYQELLSLTTILGEVCARGTREARSLSALRTVVGLVGIEGLSGGSLVFAPLSNNQSQIHDKYSRICARPATITCSREALLECSIW